MLILLGALYNLSLPYWDTLKIRLAKSRISSLTIIDAPNLVGHPIGIIILLALGLFTLPTDPTFYLSWFGMIVLSSFSLVLQIWGLLKTKFLGEEIIWKLGFLMSSLAAILLLGEQVTEMQAIAMGIATLAILFFAWPKQITKTSFTLDKGVLFVVLALFIDAFSTILYKNAALHASTYEAFLTGRFVGDLVGWTIVWVVGLVFVSKLNPLKELRRCIQSPGGKWMIVGVAATNIIDSFLIYKLPVVTFAILGTLIIPSAFLFSRFKYGETMTRHMWIGTGLGIMATLLFFYPA